MNKRLLIGVVVTSCHVEFQEEILKGIISQAFRSNCDVAILAPLNDFADESIHKQYEKNIFELILSNKFDGFLYVRNTFYSDKVRDYIDKLLERSGKPVMLLDATDHKRFESTAIDDCTAFEQITDHIIEVHNCNKIYCLTGPKKLFVSEERINGFKNSMKKHGLYYDRKCCIYGDFWKDAAKELAEKIINGELAKPDAVICGNDASAISLVETLTAGGIRVPEDIAVTGYDNTNEAQQFSPSITTFRRPNFQLGAESLRRLYRIITGKICTKVCNDNGGIIYGLSCGCNKKNNLHKKIGRRNKINTSLEIDILRRDMLFDVSNTDNPYSFADRLDNYTYYIYKMKYLEICLTRKFLELNDNLTFHNGDEMKTILSKSSVKRDSISDEYFSSSDIIQAFEKKMPYPSAYYISPLHYNDNFFGYSCISFGKEAMSFSHIYKYWTDFVNSSLEHMRIKALLKNAELIRENNSLYDKKTGLLNRNGLEKNLNNITKIHSGKDICFNFIRIQLTGLKKIYFQSGEEKCRKIAELFGNILNDCINSDEICGLWSYDTFCIITTHNKRNEDIIPVIIKEIKKTTFSAEENCNIDFTVGLYTQAANTVQNLSNAMHKSSVNRIFNYNISECTLNPQFEKICMLRNKILKNPELPWSIDSIADSMYLSKSYLQKIYKTYFGKGIIEEMIEFRIEKAKELLANTSITITEIAKECGYSSYNYFVRQFKSAVGSSPTKYRENIKKTDVQN